MFVGKPAGGKGGTYFVVGHAGVFVPHIFQRGVFVLFAFFLLKIAGLQKLAQFYFAADGRNNAQNGF